MPEDGSEEQVVLVDVEDRAIGTAPKLEVHRQGRLHRAISVVLRDSAGRFLLQKRHRAKYHSGGLWTNTCCSHPRPGEEPLAAARRRLAEEMGIEVELAHLLTTIYRAEVGNGMIEHELVHVFGAVYDGPVRPDPEEAEGFAWVSPEELEADVRARPERYSFWFRLYFCEHRPRLELPPAG
ncbi:MAG: isopentenyl-diphosphate Delta-isomerase [Geminicoccaceae bacterium]|nr:isopentenyl-diphosphate Delta-isomerase [Geminicoccaceae bacterium]MCS7266714.1 isopentenyl-diphosphate Delta-isomerase [Geminicoccaceae bacterium]MCX7628631.1 isopentenyl-diphosphate Delta-isomerase [Geminicoccaceae bacterium]MDW8124412.1 isopentenyl-diphosphate Delta-isomerase [Geminicoccaceae bacterium]MDW8342676.1 isopentenyl-diphosphate Delta-isomerase [Geminicoccaceae bacterium]